MINTLVIQSYRTEAVPEWIANCLDSVRAWAALQAYEYRFIGDEILDYVPPWYRDRAGGRMPVITDLGRLIAMLKALTDGVGTVVWVDADVVVFGPDDLHADIDGDHAFAREVWVQPGGNGLKVYRNVHNAYCIFRQGNPILDFYIHACLSVMQRVDGGVPNQIVGTKLLTAMHNLIGFPLIENVGMISPLVLRDLLADGGPALELLAAESPGSLKAANLCGSLVGSNSDGVDIDDSMMMDAVDRLRTNGGVLFGKLNVGG